MSAGPGDIPLVSVRLLELPLDLQSRSQEHSDELTREMTLVAEQMRQQGDSGGLPLRLVELIATLTEQYSMFTLEQEQQIAAALRAGQETIDLDYRVPASAAEAATAVGAIFDEADDYCQAGQHLLTLATPPELVAYRKWYLQQFVDQIAGAEPVPWPRYRSLNMVAD